GGADVHVDQGRIDRLFDRLLRTVVAIRLAEANHRDPTALHDRLDVVEIEVHEARLRDDLRDPFDGAHEDVVRDFERRIQGQTRDELKEFVIRDYDHHVRTLDDRPQFVRGLAGRLLADLGERASSQAPRDAASQEELVRGPDDEEMLGVRVRGEQLRPDDPGFDEAVNRVAAAAPDPDDLDVRPEAREDPLEFGVFRVDAHPLRGGLRESRLNTRATHDFPDNGIHFSA